MDITKIKQLVTLFESQWSKLSMKDKEIMFLKIHDALEELEDQLTDEEAEKEDEKTGC